MRIAISALAAVLVVVVVALIAKSAKAYGAEHPSVQISVCVVRGGAGPAPGSP